jgi:hypothetical protein
MFGSQPFLTALVDEPERVARLAQLAAAVWHAVAAAQEVVVPSIAAAMPSGSSASGRRRPSEIARVVVPVAES